MDFVEEMNREFTEHMQNVGKPGYEYDGCYSRITLTREVFIRMCQALQVASGIVQKLKRMQELGSEKPSEHWSRLEIAYNFFARFMQWDEKKHVRVVIDYDPAAEKVLLLRCPVTAEEEAQHTGGETE